MEDIKRMIVCEKLRKYIPENWVYILSENLQDAPENTLDYVMMLPLKNPSTTLLLSIFLGGWGIDRLYINDGLGYVKLMLTILRLIIGFVGGLASLFGNDFLLGCCILIGFVLGVAGVIWWIIDMCILSKRVKEVNAIEIAEMIETAKTGMDINSLRKKIIEKDNFERY